MTHPVGTTWKGTKITLGCLPQIGVKIKNLWNHHLVMVNVGTHIPYIECLGLILCFFSSRQTKQSEQTPRLPNSPLKRGLFLKQWNPFCWNKLTKKMVHNIGGNWENDGICLVHQCWFPWQFLGVIEMGTNPKTRLERFLVNEGWLRGVVSEDDKDHLPVGGWATQFKNMSS